MPLVLLAQLVATLLMTGVIWYVQLVHYPLMAGWPHEDFPRWEAAHRQQTGYVVVPAMLVEGITALIVLVRRPAGVPAWLAASGAVVVLVLGVSTFAIQVPLHDALSKGWDAASHARLVQSNWLRTILWTVHAALAVWMVQARPPASER